MAVRAEIFITGSGFTVPFEVRPNHTVGLALLIDEALIHILPAKVADQKVEFKVVEVVLRLSI